jgi:hypothetical protein
MTERVAGRNERCRQNPLCWFGRLSNPDFRPGISRSFPEDHHRFKSLISWVLNVKRSWLINWLVFPGMESMGINLDGHNGVAPTIAANSIAYAQPWGAQSDCALATHSPSALLPSRPFVSKFRNTREILPITLSPGGSDPIAHDDTGSAGDAPEDPGRHTPYPVRSLGTYLMDSLVHTSHAGQSRWSRCVPWGP